jgi:hypothetical protein
MVKPYSGLDLRFFCPLCSTLQGMSLFGNLGHTCLWPWGPELVLPTLVPSTLHNG